MGSITTRSRGPGGETEEAISSPVRRPTLSQLSNQIQEKELRPRATRTQTPSLMTMATMTTTANSNTRARTRTRSTDSKSFILAASLESRRPAHPERGGSSFSSALSSAPETDEKEEGGEGGGSDVRQSSVVQQSKLIERDGEEEGEAKRKTRARQMSKTASRVIIDPATATATSEELTQRQARHPRLTPKRPHRRQPGGRSPSPSPSPSSSLSFSSSTRPTDRLRKDYTVFVEVPGSPLRQRGYVGSAEMRATGFRTTATEDDDLASLRNPSNSTSISLPHRPEPVAMSNTVTVESSLIAGHAESSRMGRRDSSQRIRQRKPLTFDDVEPPVKKVGRGREQERPQEQKQGRQGEEESEHEQATNRTQEVVAITPEQATSGQEQRAVKKKSHKASGMSHRRKKTKRKGGVDKGKSRAGAEEQNMYINGNGHLGQGEARESDGQGGQREGGAEEEDEEGGDSVWEEFSADYYEVIEQLPLELHRNFALLRELDDQTQQHTAKLLETIRQYVESRLNPPSSKDVEQRAPGVGTLRAAENEAGRGGAMQVEGFLTGTRGPTETQDAKNRNEEDMDMDAASSHLPSAAEALQQLRQEDQQAIDPALLATAQTTNSSPIISGPSQISAVNGDQAPANGGPSQISAIDAHKAAVPVFHSNSVPSTAAARPNPKPGTAEYEEMLRSATHAPPSRLFLPEIGRLTREMVKGAEEKMGISIAAYDSVDRHIRALDSALQTQQASLNLGLQPGTMPSETVLSGVAPTAKAMHPDGNHNLEEAIMIGLAGGLPAGQSKKRGRKGRKSDGNKVSNRTAGDDIVALAPDGLNIGLDGHGQPVVIGPTAITDMQIDPNEPRYCTCHNVSYGEMIGCENPDCPIEWYHLECLGMTTVPVGKWYCPVCKPIMAPAPKKPKKK